MLYTIFTCCSSWFQPCDYWNDGKAKNRGQPVLGHPGPSPSACFDSYERGFKPFVTAETGRRAWPRQASNTERCKRKPRKFIFGNYLGRPCILNSYGCMKFKKYFFPESWDLDLFIERSNIFLTILEVCHWAAWKWAFLQKSKIAPNLTHNCKAQNRTKSKTN